MKIINPNEIGAKISTLITEAFEKFYVVSPYIDLSNWKKITVNLKNATQRGVKIKFFIREIREKDSIILKSLGIEIIQIKGLHTKLYFNEKEVIVSSMNLYEFSDLHSIDIAMNFKKPKEYEKVYDYFISHINSKKEESKFDENETQRELGKLSNYLVEIFPDARITATKTYLFSKYLHNKFDVFIELDHLSLKYPVRNPEQIEIDQISDLICNNYEGKVNVKTPSDKYNYCIWNIPFQGKSNSEISDIIRKLQMIN